MKMKPFRDEGDRVPRRKTSEKAKQRVADLKTGPTRAEREAFPGVLKRVGQKGYPGKKRS